MPVLFEWQSKDLLRVKYYGILDGDDAVDASTRMSSDPRFDSLKAIVIDTLDIEKNIAKLEHVERLITLSRIMTTINPRIRNAIVLNNDENTESLAAFYTFLADELVWDVKMFRKLEEAIAWSTA